MAPRRHRAQESEEHAVQHEAVDVNDIRMHYVRAGSGPPLLLLHGWGSTWYMWRELIEPLSADFTVVAPDLRGIGATSKPQGGYDKLTIARDVGALVDALDLGPVSIVGHDWGGPVAYLFTAKVGRVTRLVMLESLLMGLEFELDVRLRGPLWHNLFQAVPDLPEQLVAGREDVYLRWFYENNAFDASAISPEAVAEYVRAYSGPGALRAGFSWYRTGEKDVADIQEAARTKLTMPVLGLGGDSCLGNTPFNSLRAAAEDVTGGVLERCGHWMPEERPRETLAALRDFLR